MFTTVVLVLIIRVWIIMELFGIQDFVDNRKITSGLLGGIEISYTPVHSVVDLGGARGL